VESHKSWIAGTSGNVHAEQFDVPGNGLDNHSGVVVIDDEDPE